MDQIRSKNIKKTPDVEVSVPFALPKYLDEGSLKDILEDSHLRGDDSSFYDSGGFDPSLLGAGTDSFGGGTTLATPINIAVKSQIVRQAVGGQYVVDVIMSCSDVVGATNYEFRIAKADSVSATIPPPVGIASIGTTAAGVGATPSLPAGTTAGEFCVVFVGLESTASVSALNGWTEQATVAAVGTPYPFSVHAYTKIVTSNTDVPTFTYTSNPPVWGSARIASSSASFSSVATDTIASATSGTAPAISGANGAVRFWLTSGSGATLTKPSRLNIYSAAGGTNIKVIVGIEDDLTATTATTDVAVGWDMVTIGVARAI